MADPAPDVADLDGTVDDLRRTVTRLRVVVFVLVSLELLRLLGAVFAGAAVDSTVLVALFGVGVLVVTFLLATLTA
ncbi:hypothetical protein [Halomicrococcus gelatinilyticus]|uniref:hypothetical protein n=1 Tax=Halomicrococcus gelatinilyticus TaxID=1702103 RepID=UPI002E148521